MPVSSTHPDYDDNITDWARIRAAVSGKRKQLKVFLRKPDEDDKDRQKAYEEGAVYQNWTGRTVSGLTGAVFRKPAEVELPTGIEYMLEGADSQGNTLDQVSRSVVSNDLQIGRHGLLVDYPEAPEGLTAAQVRERQLRPVISEYVSESIINWRTDEGVLVLVVLHEMENVAKDEFDYQWEDRYRVLRLEDGYYTQTLYNEGGVQIGEVKQPTMADGMRWTFIPFIIPGSVNNDVCIDAAPMLPLSDLGIAAYQNSADYEEGVFICGQPMLHVNVGDTSVDAWDKLNPDGIRFGSRTGITTQNGSADMLQAKANSAAFEALTDKREQAVQLGAKLIESKSSNQTAEAARIDAASEHSVLDLVVGNCSDAIKKCLQWACLFTGDNPDDVVFELNKDFFDASISPQMIVAAIQMFDRRALGREDLAQLAKKADMIDSDETNEEILDRIDSEGV